MAQRHFRALVLTTGVTPELTLHDLRRTVAKSAFAVTGDLRVVQQLLGHARLNTTSDYLHHPTSLATLDGIRRTQEAEEHV